MTSGHVVCVNFPSPFLDELTSPTSWRRWCACVLQLHEAYCLPYRYTHLFLAFG